MVQKNIPESWIEVPIGAINDHKSASIKPSDYPDETFELFSVPIFPTGKPEYLKGSEIGSSKQVVEQGDVLLCKINPRINRVWWVTEKKEYRQIASSEWIVIRQPLVKMKYLRAYFSEYKFRELLCSDVTGVGGSLTRAQPKKVVTYPIKLAPENEQTRIANKLDELLAQVDTIKARIDAIPSILKRFRQSVLASAVSGKLTEEWRKSNPNQEWETLALENIAEIRDPHPSHRTPKAVEGGVPYIGIGDLKADGTIDFDGARKVSKEVLEEHNNRYTLKQGDFVFGKIGTLGKATVLPTEVDYTLSANVILIQPMLDQANPKFLMYFLSAPGTMKEVARQANSTSQAAFGIKKMRAFITEVPSLDEQNQIVRQVEQLFALAEQIEQRVKEAQARINNLTQSILAKAFRGELVPQDPNDEPASVLLDRIKQEREAAAKLVKAAKKVVKKKVKEM